MVPQTRTVQPAQHSVCVVRVDAGVDLVLVVYEELAAARVLDQDDPVDPLAADAPRLRVNVQDVHSVSVAGDQHCLACVVVERNALLQFAHAICALIDQRWTLTGEVDVHDDDAWQPQTETMLEFYLHDLAGRGLLRHTMTSRDDIFANDLPENTRDCDWSMSVPTCELIPPKRLVTKNLVLIWGVGFIDFLQPGYPSMVKRKEDLSYILSVLRPLYSAAEIGRLEMCHRSIPFAYD